LRSNRAGVVSASIVRRATINKLIQQFFDYAVEQQSPAGGRGQPVVMQSEKSLLHQGRDFAGIRL
jgi:hypothetical protein